VQLVVVDADRERHRAARRRALSGPERRVDARAPPRLARAIATRLLPDASTSRLLKADSIVVLARSTLIPPTGTPPTVTSLAMSIGAVVVGVVVVGVVVVGVVTVVELLVRSRRLS